MKQAWLVRDFWYEDDEDDSREYSDWKIIFSEPRQYEYREIKPIVYAELENNGH